MSRANLHLWFPDSLDPTHTEHRQFPPAGGVGRARIAAASTNGRALLVLHPPGEPNTGVGRVYVEYRDNRNWDRGLDVFGADLARAGVVVHTVENTAAGRRVWYRGSIVPGAVDTDLNVAGRPLAITLEDFETRDNQPGWAEISYQGAAVRTVTITESKEEIVLGGNPIREETTPCGQTITFGSWAVLSGYQLEVSTTGFGGDAASRPVVTWAVGGTLLAGREGTVEVPFGDVSFTMEYTIDPVSFELSLTARGGERYDAEVVATVSLGAETSSATTVLRSRGFYEGYTPEDQAVLSECLASIFDRANIPREAPRFRIPTPDPPDFDPERWRERALERLRGLSLDPPAARAIETIIRLQALR